MTVIIENEALRATFAELGAELVSLQLKSEEIEYIWQADPQYWARHAPVLFPIVGRLKNDEYVYNDKTFHMSQHGFARDALFEVINQGKESVSFRLKSSAETKKQYPFDFELVLSYRLEDMRLIVEYQVKNLDEKRMYFSIGGHPAFNVPLEKKLNFEDYYLKFTPEKPRVSIPLEGAYLDVEKKTCVQTNPDIPFNRELFKNDALIYETKGENSYSIQSDKGQRKVTVGYADMPFVGIWSPYPKEAPFVCIEPWCGVADSLEANGQLEAKLGIQTLQPEALFENSYFIEVS